MARQSNLDHLASVSLFSACSQKELQAVERASDQVELAAGRALCEQGSIGREAFIILDGEAEVVAQRTQGRHPRRGRLLRRARAPRPRPPHRHGVTATTDLDVLVIGAREFAGILDDVPPIAHKMLKALAARIRELDAKTYG